MERTRARFIPGAAHLRAERAQTKLEVSIPGLGRLIQGLRGAQSRPGDIFKPNRVHSRPEEIYSGFITGFRMTTVNRGELIWVVELI